MIRITELSLPLDHAADALRPAIVRRLGIKDTDLLEFTVFKRSYDARKKNSTIAFVYIIDVVARNEAAILQRLAHDHNVRPAPDTSYHAVAQAPAALDERPLIVGFGPCGLFAALLLAPEQDFRLIRLGRAFVAPRLAPLLPFALFPQRGFETFALVAGVVELLFRGVALALFAFGVEAVIAAVVAAA